MSRIKETFISWRDRVFPDYHLYKMIDKNSALAQKRHPLFEKSKMMKYLSAFMLLYFGAIFIFYGVILWLIFKDSNREAFDWMDSGIIFVMTLDFYLRYLFMETPSQEVKPYRLLPIPTNFLLNIFLWRNAKSLYNIWWGTLYIPFGLMAIALMPFGGWCSYLSWLVGLWLLFVMNGFYYLFWSSLTRRNLLWIIPPTLIWAALIYCGIFWGEWLFYGQMHLMRGFVWFNPLSYIGVLAAIALLVYINKKMQARMVYQEIAKEEKVDKVKSTDMSWLNRFGVIGEYMKLEVKSQMRNRFLKNQFFIGFGMSVLLSCLMAFTDVYDNMLFMRVFICVYAFSIMTAITLQQIMGAEGNYMDGLMARRESVLSLLKAKYLFCIGMTVIPFIIQMIPVAQGKLSFISVVGCMFFAIGVLMPALFQMAAYNSTTINLNQKMKTGNNGAANNSKTQMIVYMVVMFMPILLMYILVVTFSDSVASLLMMLCGVIGMATSKWWLENIYARFMKRRYKNMQGFRDTCPN